MTGARRLAAAALLLLAAAPTAARADTGADSLVISAHCRGTSGTVNIATDARLHGRVLISGAVGNVTPPAGGVGPATVEASCDDGATATLTIPADPHFLVTIDSIGDTDWHLGTLPGPLTATLRGGGNLHADRLGGLTTVDTVAASDVTIGALAAPATLQGRGSGDFTIGSVAADTLDLDLAGSGDAKIGAGHVGALTVATRGSGDVTVAATAGSADLSSFGSGDVSVAAVTGPVHRKHFGSGDVTVGRGGNDDVSIQWNETAGRGITVDDGRGHAATIPEGDVDKIRRVAVVALRVALLLAALAAAAFYLLGRGRRRSRSGAVAGPADPRVADLGATLQRLARRASHLESVVTSREFELHRGFRDLGE